MTLDFPDPRLEVESLVTETCL